MLKSLTIDNFKCFEHLELSDLGQFNLITGRNNVGKSSLLEAIELALPFTEREALSNINSHRAMPSDFYYTSLFNSDKRVSKLCLELEYLSDVISVMTKILPIPKSLREQLVENIKINGNNISSAQKIFESVDSEDTTISGLRFIRKINEEIDFDSHILDTGIVVSEDNGRESKQRYYGFNPELRKYIFFNTIVSSSKETLGRFQDHEKCFDQIQILGQVGNMCEALSNFSHDFSVSDIRLIKGHYYVKTKESAHLIPLASYGDGIGHYFVLLSYILSAKEETLFIFDEIDTGLHYSSQKLVWKAIFNALKKNTNSQIFATTHSMECVKAFSEVANEGKGFDARLINLVKHPDKPHMAMTYKKEEMSDLLEAGMGLT